MQVLRALSYILCSVGIFYHNNALIIAQEKSLTPTEFEIPATEDLMREHGILNRLLLVYEELIIRIERNEFPRTELSEATRIMQDFIENYHEKLEEDYIFPLFEKAKKKIPLVKTLRQQHAKGRIITDRLREIVRLPGPLNKRIQREAKRLLKQFVRMYRPHEAREDTVLFPQVRALISEQDFKAMSDLFEKREHELFGEQGFENMVKRVKVLEKELGIYKLEQFTPNI